MAQSQAEYLKQCRSNVVRSKRWRNNAEMDEDWRRWVDLYRGRHYEQGTSVDNDRLIVNLAFATMNILGPAVALQYPRFVVNPRSPESAEQAALAEEVLNYTWQAHDMHAEFRLAVQDFLAIGHGWIKVGYHFPVKPKEVKTDDVDNLGDDEYGVVDVGDEAAGAETKLTTFDSTQDRPFVERISPFDMFVDPDARHPKEMRWIAQRVWRNVADVKVDPRYSKTARERVNARSWSAFQSSADADARDSWELADRGSTAFAEVIEFYDLKTKQVSTFALNGDSDNSAEAGEQAGGFLIKPEGFPYAFGNPFVMMRNYEVPDHFYPIGDIEQIESLQLELNETRTQMMNHRKRFARKWLYNKDSFDRRGVAALEGDTDNTMIPVLGDENPASAIAPVPAVVTPPEFYNQSDLITNDIDQVSGVSDYQRGGNEAVKRTATEAAMIQDASNARAQDRLAKIENVLAEIGEALIALMQQFLTGKHVARITSLPGDVFLSYDKNYIAGEFQFEVVGGSTEPRNETFRRQSSMQLVDASMPFLEMGVADPVALYRKVLSGFGIKDTTEYISKQAQQGGPPPPGGPQGEPPQPAGPGGPPPPGALPPGPAPGGAGPGGPPPGVAPPGGQPPIEEIVQLLTQAGAPPALIQQIVQTGEVPPQVMDMLMQAGGGPPGGPGGASTVPPPVPPGI